MKKVLAMILAVAMLVTVFSALSFADDDYDIFIDFNTEEGRAYGAFDAVDPDTRYHEENHDWFVRIRNKTADDQDANESNGGLYNNKFILTFNSESAAKAELMIKTRLPDSKYGASGYILGVLVNSTNDDDFELYNVEDLGAEKSEPFDYDKIVVDVKEGENKIAFIQLQGSGTGGNGWSIEFLSIGVKFENGGGSQAG